VKDRVEIERRMRDKAVKECRGDEGLGRGGIGSRQSLLAPPQSAVLLVRMCCVCCRLGVCHVEGGSQVRSGRSVKSARQRRCHRQRRVRFPGSRIAGALSQPGLSVLHVMPLHHHLPLVHQISQIAVHHHAQGKSNHSDDHDHKADLKT
jgi:hypothetical protein